MPRRSGDDDEPAGSGLPRDDDERVIPFARPISATAEPPREAWHRPGFSITDENLAACFIAKRGDDFCYSRQRRVWRAFDGKVWQDDALLQVHDAVTTLLGEVGAVAAKRIKDKIRIGSRAMVVAVEAQARGRLSIDEGLFDINPWLLNTPDGTFDLKVSGGLAMRRHDRLDYLTKLTRVSPGGECPQWLEFLDAVTVGDADLQSYLQRLFGYALVGVTSEQMLAYCHGTGGNGKGVMLSTLLHALGDYGVTVSSEVFAAQQFARHTEELMPMRGARLIVASETESGHSWNESRIKQLTGGDDKIRARYMRENSVEFTISGLICIMANHLLELANVDDAIKRRLHMVPFAAKFEGERIDKGIGDKLKAEAGGVLQWMCEGCRMWQAEGLQPPEAVMAATDEYISGEDHVAEFAEECLVTHVLATMVTKTSDLYAAWKKFAEARGYEVGGINPFSRNLVRLGFEKNKSNKHGRTFKRVAIKE